jgi:exosome complex RNA-binding protein Rrp42 (RNase PH superfamily)
LTEDIPITITFHKIGENFIVDPTRDEENTSEGRLTMEISYSKGKKEEMINAMQKGEKVTFTIEDVEKMLEEGRKIFKNIKSVVDTEIKKSSKK